MNHPHSGAMPQPDVPRPDVRALVPAGAGPIEETGAPVTSGSEISEELLSAYFDGEVTPAERELVEQSLHRSSAALQAIASFGELRTMLRGLPQVELPRSFGHELQSQLDQAHTLAHSPTTNALAASVGSGDATPAETAAHVAMAAPTTGAVGGGTPFVSRGKRSTWKRDALSAFCGALATLAAVVLLAPMARHGWDAPSGAMVATGGPLLGKWAAGPVVSPTAAPEGAVSNGRPSSLELADVLVADSDVKPQRQQVAMERHGTWGGAEFSEAVAPGTSRSKSGAVASMDGAAAAEPAPEPAGPDADDARGENAERMAEFNENTNHQPWNVGGGLGGGAGGLGGYGSTELAATEEGLNTYSNGVAPFSALGVQPLPALASSTTDAETIRLRVGDVVKFLPPGTAQVGVIEFKVVDIEQAATEMQTLLAQNNIQILPGGMPAPGPSPAMLPTPFDSGTAEYFAHQPLSDAEAGAQSTAPSAAPSLAMTAKDQHLDRPADASRPLSAVEIHRATAPESEDMTRRDTGNRESGSRETAWQLPQPQVEPELFVAYVDCDARVLEPVLNQFAANRFVVQSELEVPLQPLYRAPQNSLSTVEAEQLYARVPQGQAGESGMLDHLTTGQLPPAEQPATRDLNELANSDATDAAKKTTAEDPSASALMAEADVPAPSPAAAGLQKRMGDAAPKERQSESPVATKPAPAAAVAVGRTARSDVPRADAEANELASEDAAPARELARGGAMPPGAVPGSGDLLSESLGFDTSNSGTAASGPLGDLSPEAEAEAELALDQQAYREADVAVELYNTIARPYGVPAPLQSISALGRDDQPGQHPSADGVMVANPTGPGVGEPEAPLAASEIRNGVVANESLNQTPDQVAPAEPNRVASKSVPSTKQEQVMPRPAASENSPGAADTLNSTALFDRSSQLEGAALAANGARGTTEAASTLDAPLGVAADFQFGSSHPEALQTANTRGLNRAVSQYLYAVPAGVAPADMAAQTRARSFAYTQSAGQAASAGADANPALPGSFASPSVAAMADESDASAKDAPLAATLPMRSFGPPATRFNARSSTAGTPNRRDSRKRQTDASVATAPAWDEQSLTSSPPLGPTDQPALAESESVAAPGMAPQQATQQVRVLLVLQRAGPP